MLTTALDWIRHHALAAWLMLSPLLLVALRTRTPAQWVALGESIPRVQAAIKLLRGLGVDPVRVAEGALQLFSGRHIVDPRDARIAEQERLLATLRAQLDGAVLLPGRTDAAGLSAAVERAKAAAVDALDAHPHVPPEALEVDLPQEPRVPTIPAPGSPPPPDPTARVELSSAELLRLAQTDPAAYRHHVLTRETPVERPVASAATAAAVDHRTGRNDG